jgi:ribonuclease-3
VSEGGARRPAAELEAALGLRFRDPELLAAALTHASLAHERGGGRGNERLEFLGDAVVDLAAARLLYDAHPEWAEGELTRARASLVNGRSLAACARRLSLGSFVGLGRTELQSGGADKDSILANVFEALLGALYLDAGLEPALEFARRVFGSGLESAGARDPKTSFQEWAHEHRHHTPVYETAGDSGRENDEERFRVVVRVGGEVWGSGTGRSKQAAERRAALAALARAEAGDG